MPEELAPVIIAESDLNVTEPEIPCRQLNSIILKHLE
jgi:hypothetical protein